MAGLRQEKADDTRRRILAAARLLFAQRGYFDTGTTEIVDSAEVGTRGALYHHFADKKALFAAVFEEVEQDLSQKAGTSVGGTSGFELLRSGLESFLDASLENEVRQILLIDGPAVLGWEAWREIEERYGLGAIRGMLEQGMADGSMRPLDPDAMSHLLLSVVDEAALYIAHADDRLAARHHAGSSLGALLSGLAG